MELAGLEPATSWVRSKSVVQRGNVKDADFQDFSATAGACKVSLDEQGYARYAGSRGTPGEKCPKFAQGGWNKSRLASSSSTKILGGFFAKEIDVVIAEYDRGLELGVSTKTMTKSFGKNITNRFEEASGDLLNIRRDFRSPRSDMCSLSPQTS